MISKLFSSIAKDGSDKAKEKRQTKKCNIQAILIIVATAVHILLCLLSSLLFIFAQRVIIKLSFQKEIQTFHKAEGQTKRINHVNFLYNANALLYF